MACASERPPVVAQADVLGAWPAKENMQFPYWLMTGGALLVLVGVVGIALQRRRAAADPSNLEQGEVADARPASLPKFLE